MHHQRDKYRERRSTINVKPKPILVEEPENTSQIGVWGRKTVDKTSLIVPGTVSENHLDPYQADFSQTMPNKLFVEHSNDLIDDMEFPMENMGVNIGATKMKMINSEDPSNYNINKSSLLIKKIGLSEPPNNYKSSDQIRVNNNFVDS